MKRNKTIVILTVLLSLVGCKSNSSSLSTTSIDSSSSGESKLVITKPIQSLIKRTCPSKGKIKALVVPVHFSNDSTSINLDVMKSGFTNNITSSIAPESGYSVEKFYKESSYNQLEFDFTFLDTYIPEKPSSYYENKANFNGDSYNTNASRSLYKEVLEANDSKIDYSQYDSNKDGVIDAMFMVYDHPVDYTYKNMFWWAYTSWYEQDDTFDGVKLGRFVWYGQDFFSKDNLVCNTKTLIHETSHLFGIDDYYDYDTTKGASKGGIGGADLMDNDKGSPSGDHNPYSKALLGWTSPRVITLKGKGTEQEFSLKPFQENGDTLILANDFDKEKEMYQEYFTLEYYTPTGIMANDKPFNINGIRVIHVSSQLDSKGRIKYDNTSTTYKLLSQINTSQGGTYINESISRDDTTLFTEGESLLNVEYNNSDVLKYQFEVIRLTNEEATIKVTVKY